MVKLPSEESVGMNFVQIYNLLPSIRTLAILRNLKCDRFLASRVP